MKKSYRKVSAPQGISNLGTQSKTSLVTKLIDRKDIAQALKEIDALAASAGPKGKQATNLVSLAGDSQFALGRFDDAAKLYARAFSMLDLREDADSWLRPVLGEVRARIRNLQTEGAKNRALKAVALAKEQHIEYKKLISAADGQLKQSGSVDIGAQPISVGEVGFRLGRAFQLTGSPELAKQFYKVTMDEGLSCVPEAKHGLAELALAEGDGILAEKFAQQSVREGKYGAKTIRTWPILISARATTGKSPLDTAIWDEFKNSASAGVLDRATMLVAQSLRKLNVPDWKLIAEERYSHHQVNPVTKVELAKVLLSEEMLLGTSPETAIRYASVVIEDPLTSPKEFLGAAKDYFAAALQKDKVAPDILNIEAIAIHRYDTEFRWRLLHAMALGAMPGKYYDTARTLLGQIVSACKTSNPVQWGTSIWATAHMEEMLANTDKATALYLEFADNPSVPERFRIQGLLKFVKLLPLLSSLPDLTVVEGKLKSILANIRDYYTLLNVARDLSFAPAPFSELANSVADQGEALALEAIKNASTPAEARLVLLRITRRRTYELGRLRQVVDQWEDFNPAYKSSLWSEDSMYWEYLALVIESYGHLNEYTKAVSLAQGLLDANNAPPHGLVFIAVTLANVNVRQGFMDVALDLFRMVAKAQPTHEWNAWGLYWLGLDSFKKGTKSAAIDYFTGVRRCFAGRPKYLWQWRLDAQAAILLGDTNNRTGYDEAFLREQRLAIDSNLAKL